MYRTTRVMCWSLVLGLFACTASFAQDDGELKDLKNEVAELKKEISSLKAELKGMRGDISRAVAAMSRSGGQGARRQRPAMAMVGKPAPEFPVTTVDGSQLKIGGKREKPQVVYCYASWCGFCKKSLPWIDSLHKKYSEKGVEVVALNLDARGEGGRARSEQQTLDHYKSMNLSVPMAMTTSSTDTKRIGSAYKAQSFPTLFVVGPSGEVESVHIGAKQGLADTVGKELDVLLSGKNRTAFPK